MYKPYTIEVDSGITIVTFAQKPSFLIFCEAVHAVTMQPENTYRLWDLHYGMDLSSEDLKKLAELAKIKLTSQSSKAAIVAPDDLTFGLSRVLDVFREDDLVEQKIFRSRAEAMDWLMTFQRVKT